MGFPRQEFGMGCHFLLQGILPTHGLNLSLLRWQMDSLPLSHQGSPNMVLPFHKIDSRHTSLSSSGMCWIKPFMTSHLSSANQLCDLQVDKYQMKISFGVSIWENTMMKGALVRLKESGTLVTDQCQKRRLSPWWPKMSLWPPTWSLVRRAALQVLTKCRAIKRWNGPLFWPVLLLAFV